MKYLYRGWTIETLQNRTLLFPPVGTRAKFRSVDFGYEFGANKEKEVKEFVDSWHAQNPALAKYCEGNTILG